MRILFISATRVGDAVLSTGLADHLLRTYPDARITVVCGPAAAGVFARMPRRQRTILLEKQRFDLHWLGLWARTSGTLWDLVVDLRGSALSYLVPARRRCVWRGGPREGHRLTHLAAVLGLAEPPLPVVWTDATDRVRADNLLGRPGPHPGPPTAPPEARRPLIGLGPTANWDGKVWPAERFVALFKALATDMPGARAVIFGGPGTGERELAAPVLAGLPGAVDLVGRLSLSEAAACLARCDLFVGNDSGLMHLAAAAGTPTLGLFGPTDARLYAPSGPRTAVARAPGPAGAAPIADLPLATVLAAARVLRADLAAAPGGVPRGASNAASNAAPDAAPMGRPIAGAM